MAVAKIYSSKNDVEMNGLKRTEVEKRLYILENKTQTVSILENLTYVMKHRNYMYIDIHIPRSLTRHVFVNEL